MLVPVGQIIIIIITIMLAHIKICSYLMIGVSALAALHSLANTLKVDSSIYNLKNTTTTTKKQ